MTASSWKFAAAASLAMIIGACQQQPGSTSGTGATTAGGTTGTTTGTTGTTGGTGTSTTVPTLVNVNLQNVLNNLSVALKVDRANIPVNAQVPIDVAANVCGVSVNVLAASIASGRGGCTATTTSPSLVQYVQQQLSAGGGTQTTGTTTNNMI
ncbi:MAG: hypothetical protein ACJ8FO_07370 [Sphingomicrobium sp.]